MTRKYEPSLELTSLLEFLENTEKLLNHIGAEDFEEAHRIVDSLRGKVEMAK
jgi:hypothetical protein